MKIVVLDGYTANPGDLSWDGLRAFGELFVYDRTDSGEVVSRADCAGIVLTNKTYLGEKEMEALPKLAYIGVLATGYNVVDLAEARKRGIAVTNIPAYSTASVAQTVFALLFELTNRVGVHSNGVHSGRWTASPDFCYWDFPLIELDGQTLGIIGYGNIGKAVAKIARALGMTVVCSTRAPPSTAVEGVEFAGADEVFRKADVLSLHCPLTFETELLVNERTLALMNPGAFIINTARGGLIDEPALASALNSGLISGAGLDVLSQEPPSSDNPLLNAKNCIITPHIGWASQAARKRLIAGAIDNVRAFIEGIPKNRVD